MSSAVTQPPKLLFAIAVWATVNTDHRRSGRLFQTSVVEVKATRAFPNNLTALVTIIAHHPLMFEPKWTSWKRTEEVQLLESHHKKNVKLEFTRAFRALHPEQLLNCFKYARFSVSSANSPGLKDLLVSLNPRENTWTMVTRKTRETLVSTMPTSCRALEEHLSRARGGRPSCTAA